MWQRTEESSQHPQVNLLGLPQEYGRKFTYIWFRVLTGLWSKTLLPSLDRSGAKSDLVWNCDVCVIRTTIKNRGGEMTCPSYPTRPAKLIIVSVAVFSLTAAGAHGQGSGLQKAKALPPQTISDPNASSTQGSANSSSSYVIGPGDLLAINVLHEPEVSQKVPVRMDGKISMPLIGEIQASGLVPANLQATIAAKLHDYIKDAEVTVVVEEIKSRQFSVMGEVEHPGTFPLVKPTSVLEGLAQAGAFRDFAKVKKIHILRKTSEGTTITLPFNYKEVSKGRNESENVQLQAGDTIIVP